MSAAISPAFMKAGTYLLRAGSSVDLVTPVEEGADRQVRGSHREVGIAPAVQHLSVL
ncbi:hypothetical protein [Streptomyces mirabilis]|uniref:hypothetical protein n=1 Tax=Streptomyces mirabilis TaxID=68239 RepID=UPI0036B04806